MFKFNHLYFLVLLVSGSLFALHENKDSPENKGKDTSVSRSIPLENLGKLHPQTKQLLASKVNEIDFIPVSSLELQGRVFYFSKVFRTPDFSNHDYVVMYTHNDQNLLVSRLIYKSSTAGGFRCCPSLLLRPSLHFSKGNYHYTQETKLTEEIILHLEMMDSLPIYRHRLDLEVYKAVEGVLLPFFDMLAYSGSKARREKRMEVIDGINTYLEMGVDSYDQEIKLYAPLDASLASYLSFSPSEGFTIENPHARSLKAKDFYDRFRELEFSSFAPDFTAPLRSYTYSHAILGMTKVYVFLGKLDEQDVEWHFAHDEQSRVWIERISFAKKTINSYGISSLLINSGLLTHKPIEQRPQVILLLNDTENLSAAQRVKPFLIDSKDTGIYDITPLLDELKPIKDFRKAMGINR